MNSSPLREQSFVESNENHHHRQLLIGILRDTLPVSDGKAAWANKMCVSEINDQRIPPMGALTYHNLNEHTLTQNIARLVTWLAQ